MTSGAPLHDIADRDARVSAPTRAGEAEDWDARARAALAERRDLTHAGVSMLSDDDLVALGAAVAAVRRDADRMMGVVAAEQASRSRAKAAAVGLARKRGKGDERGLVSAQTGGSNAEAGRLIELGEMLRDAEQASGGSDQERRDADATDAEPRPVFPQVAAAVRAGELSVEASSMITRMLRRVGERVAAPVLAEAEKDLVFSARFMRVERLAGLITRTEERLDREHREQLARERRERRFLRIGESPDGMITVNGRLDPDNGAPLVAVMQAMVNQHFRLRKRLQDAAKAGQSVVIDERTPEQVRADAMGDFARHLAGCDVDVLPRSGVTLVVRTDLEDLRTGLGRATVDGLAAGIDAGTLRRMASTASIIPQVMDGPTVVLDHGRTKQHFTRAQKIALVERDGGCAMCGAPPSWCDAHHILPWSQGGVTDMDNGVLLCVRCHHDVHRDDWTIHATTDDVWFTPPASVDPSRRRRPGARRLFDAHPLEPEHGEVGGPDEPGESRVLAEPGVRDERGEPDVPTEPGGLAELGVLGESGVLGERSEIAESSAHMAPTSDDDAHDRGGALPSAGGNADTEPNCGLVARERCAVAPASMGGLRPRHDSGPAQPRELEREVDAVLQSELERWLEEVLDNHESGRPERAEPRAPHLIVADAPLHSQATRRTTDA